jgi:hypothetical protein
MDFILELNSISRIPIQLVIGFFHRRATGDKRKQAEHVKGIPQVHHGNLNLSV